MKKLNVSLFILSVFFAAVIDTSCKSKNKESTDTSTMNSTVDTSPSVTPPAPVEISSDDILKQGVVDATKDYPTVKAEVVDSVINLSGEIKRADWQKLNPTLNSLHPKRVNSAALTIK